MGTLITIWLVLMGLYYLCIVCFHIALKLPVIVAFIVCLPAMPFIVAYRNRKEHPIQAKFIYWLQGVLYALFFLGYFLDKYC